MDLNMAWLVWLAAMVANGVACGLIGFAIGWRGASRAWREEYQRREEK